MSARALYVYYKVDAAKAACLRELVLSLHARIRHRYPPIQIQWMQREGCGDTMSDPQTWMEVFQHPSGIDGDMQQFIEASAAAQALESSGQMGPRHIEVFIPCV